MSEKKTQTFACLNFPFTLEIEIRNNKHLVWKSCWKRKSCWKVIGINPYSNPVNYHIISSSSPYCGGNISISRSKETEDIYTYIWVFSGTRKHQPFSSERVSLYIKLLWARRKINWRHYGRALCSVSVVLASPSNPANIPSSLFMTNLKIILSHLNIKLDRGSIRSSLRDG